MKLDKILSIIVFVVMLLTIVTNIAYAFDPNPASISITAGSGASGIQNMGGKIIGTIQIAGSVIAVAILVVLGIKYMMGSTEEKAEYKKTLMPYIVGAVLIFAAANVASVVYNAANELTADVA